MFCQQSQSFCLFFSLLKSGDNEVGFVVVLHHIQRVAYFRVVLEATQVYSLAWKGLLNIATEVILHESDFTLVVATHKSVVGSENSLFDKDCSRQLVGLFIDVAFDGDALGFHAMVLVQVYLFVCQLKDFLFQKFDVDSFSG